MRIAVIVASCMALLGALSAPAGAVTWTNTGDTAFTATSGPSTMSSTGIDLVCPGDTMTVTTSTAPFVGAVWTAFRETTRSINCRFGGVDTSVHCNSELTLTTQTSGVSAGTLDSTCETYVSGTKLCHLHYRASAAYANPAGAMAVAHVFHASGTVTDVPPGRCPWPSSRPYTTPTKRFQITAATGGPSAPHTGPVIVRE